MPDYITITETLRKAKSLNEFRENGKAILGMPWYLLARDGNNLVPDVIGRHTDPDKLRQWIREGRVFIPSGVKILDNKTVEV